MIVRSTSVYSSSVGLLREAREREARGRIGSGIYTMPLAIRVHRRVEINAKVVGNTIIEIAIRVHTVSILIKKTPRQRIGYQS